MLCLQKRPPDAGSNAMAQSLSKSVSSMSLEPLLSMKKVGVPVPDDLDISHFILHYLSKGIKCLFDILFHVCCMYL